MGDGPGHDPEDHSGLTTDTVIGDVNDLGAVILPILIGLDGDAHRFAEDLAGGTGGTTFDTEGDVSNVGAEVVAAVESIALAPIASAGGPYIGNVDVPVRFDAGNSVGVNGTIANYEWDFDGTGRFVAAHGPVTIHRYTTPFTGMASVRVTDSRGGVAVASAPVRVTKAVPTVSLTPSAGAVLAGDPLIWMADVAGPAGAGTGSVTFLDGGRPIGEAPLLDGSGSITTTTLAVGSHILTAKYNGDAHLLPGASPPAVEIVTAPLVVLGERTERQGTWLAASDGGVFSVAGAP